MRLPAFCLQKAKNQRKPPPRPMSASHISYKWLNLNKRNIEPSSFGVKSHQTSVIGGKKEASVHCRLYFQFPLGPFPTDSNQISPKILQRQTCRIKILSYRHNAPFSFLLKVHRWLPRLVETMWTSNGPCPSRMVAPRSSATLWRSTIAAPPCGSR